MAASTWPGIRGTGPVPKSLRPMEPNAAKPSTPSAAVHGTPTKIPAGPAIEVKAAALKEDTIRSVSVWSPNRNKRNHLAAGEILPLFYSLFRSRLSVQCENQNHFREFSEGHIMVGYFYLFRNARPNYLYLPSMSNNLFFISVWKGLLV